MDDLPPGHELFGYTIQRKLARGGMGTVYLAVQQSLGRQVALKVMHPQRAAATDAAAFLREARAAAQINHPNLVVVHDAHVEPARHLACYAMEYVPGETATALVQRLGPLPRARALHISYLVAKALEAAHRAGLVHRDVKPDNILVTANGVVKLLDLGLVRALVDVGEQPPGPRRLSLVGTPEYSAPEQHRNPDLAGPAADVYSLGATLFFLLAGRHPHTGDTLLDLVVRMATEEPAWPTGVADDCRALLQLLLARPIEERLADGSQVVQVLEAMARGEPPRLPPPPATGLTGKEETEPGMRPVGGPPSRPLRSVRRRRYR
jgi:serine/threonine-protein kinase